MAAGSDEREAAVRIVVDTSAPGAARFALREAGALDAFAAEVPAALSASDLAAAIAASGGRIRVEGDHLFVDPEWLRESAGAAADDEEWGHRFDGMLAYAARAGWADGAGAVRAHIVVG